MKQRHLIEGETHDRVSILEFLKSLGIQLALIARDLVDTDAAYSQEWIISRADRMVCISELAHEFFHEIERVEFDLTVELPEDMVGVTVKNPLHKGDRIDTSPSGEVHDADDSGEFPF